MQYTENFTGTKSRRKASHVAYALGISYDELVEVGQEHGIDISSSNKVLSRKAINDVSKAISYNHPHSELLSGVLISTAHYDAIGVDVSLLPNDVREYPIDFLVTHSSQALDELEIGVEQIFHSGIIDSGQTELGTELGYTNISSVEAPITGDVISEWEAPYAVDVVNAFQLYRDPVQEALRRMQRAKTIIFRKSKIRITRRLFCKVRSIIQPKLFYTYPDEDAVRPHLGRASYLVPI